MEKSHKLGKRDKRNANKVKNSRVFKYDGYDSDHSDTEKYMKEYAEQEDDDDFEPGRYIFPGLLIKNEKSSYILIHIIDGGNNGHIWLSYRIDDQKYFVIKIQDFECYKGGVSEKKILKYINERETEDCHTIKLLDYFLYTAEEEYDDVKKRYHFVCTVYEIYAGSLIHLLETGKYKYGLPIDVVKNITRQVLKSVKFIHDELHIIHADIKPDNILFEGVNPKTQQIIDAFEATNFHIRYTDLLNGSIDSKNFNKDAQNLAFACVKTVHRTLHLNDKEEENISDDEDVTNDIVEDDASSYYEDSDYESESRIANNRNQSVDDDLSILAHQDPVDLNNCYLFDEVMNTRATSKDKACVVDDQYVLDCKVVLADFGNAVRYDDRTTNEIQSRFYRAPEVVMDLPYGFSVDIWSIGCLVFHLLTGYQMFDFSDSELNLDLNTLFLFEKLAGPIPLEMKKKCGRSAFLFDKTRDFHIRHVAEFKPFELKDRLMMQYLFTEQEATEISEFIMSILIYDPDERPTAAEILNHKWLSIN